MTPEPAAAAGRPWWKRRWGCGLSVLAAALLLAAASVRHERREYRDGAGRVTAIRSELLMPWQRFPPMDGHSGSVTSRARLVFGIVTWNYRESRELTRVGVPP